MALSKIYGNHVVVFVCFLLFFCWVGEGGGGGGGKK